MVMLLDYMLWTDLIVLSERIITVTNIIGLFVHGKSHEYRVTETNYYDVTLV